MEKIAVRSALGVLVFIIFAIVAIYSPWGARRIEATLKLDVDSRLAEAGLDWAQAEIDGRIVRLSGLGPHQEAIAAAKAAADGPGVSRVDISAVDLAPPAEPPVSLPVALAPPEPEPTPKPVETEEPPAPTLADCKAAINRALKGRRITFLSSSTRLSRSDQAILDDLATSLPDCGDIAVTVEGHTDSSGSARSNQALSEKRASVVADYLGERAPLAKLDRRGYGESRPIASNRTQAGRSANRRIDFVAAAATANEGETQAQ